MQHAYARALTDTIPPGRQASVHDAHKPMNAATLSRASGPASFTPASQPIALRTVAELPSPRGLPLLGKLHQVQPASLHLTLERWFAELGGTYTFRLGGRRIVVMADGEALQTALRSRPEHFRRSSLIEPVFDEMGANGVFSVEGPAWRPQRQLVMQALSPAQLRGFHPTLRQITQRLLRHWQQAAATGRTVEMTNDLIRHTVDVTTALAFGEDPNTLERDGAQSLAHAAGPALIAIRCRTSGRPATTINPDAKPERQGEPAVLFHAF